MSSITSDIMKAESVIKIGLRVEFTMIDGDEKKTFASRIEDIEGDKLVVAMPFDSRRIPIIPERGVQVLGNIVGKTCGYKFVATFLDAVAIPLPVWILKKPPIVERFQQREFVRVKVTRPIIVHPLDDEGRRKPMVTTNTVDISGGGVCFVLSEPLEVDSEITMDIPDLPELEIEEILGKIVRCQEVEVAGVKLYQMGVKFIGLSAAEQNKLIKYVFELQRISLKRGLK